MKPFFLLLISCVLSLNAAAQDKAESPSYAIVIHGGAGRVAKDAEHIKRREAVLEEALSLGESLLKSGESSLKVVEQVIRILEDAPEFNAGRGAVFNAAGGHELDASIMDGRNRAGGAVAGVSTIRHPISLARHVMTDTRHVLLATDGAEKFADELGPDTISRVPNDWFSTDRQRANLKKAQAAIPMPDHFRIGTVGCVALDNDGNIAAGTSTGGLTNKKYGRVGDSPIIGAGTFADNATCGVSCTGVGEDFIRNAVAFNISALMEYKSETLENAVKATLHHPTHKISGGIIAISAAGEIEMQFNTEGMSRAAADSQGRREIVVANPVFHANFEDGKMDRFEPTDASAWTVGVEDGNHFLSLTKKRSDFEPPVRSPYNRALVKDLEVDSFVMDVDLQSTIPDYNHRDLCLFFGYQDDAHLYYVHLGKKTDDHANQIFIVNDEPRKKISTKTTPGIPWNDDWHHARIVRDTATGSIEVYYDDMTTPVMTATDKSFGKGRVGVGSFDDTGNFDEIRVFAK
ncbi:isoaspartyl peptidase/L-asparaginase family protein [Fuerstiella marisgermanici]|uniref:Isoaspartyl peptidase n=1 Tax=Fuerstiella marisgermanici TaxID=1891926 RepID=A0A1P8W918_9PLAN|nr:isoaspartyl peptidase/L-asparaginase [Fuerstiella marisgermanici]APZ90563.1 Isoaspartyl peptidase precursor [Fuerstiella marisgermanici]